VSLARCENVLVAHYQVHVSPSLSSVR
jgi:hypothetical protein